MLRPGVWTSPIRRQRCGRRTWFHLAARPARAGHRPGPAARPRPGGGMDRESDAGPDGAAARRGRGTPGAWLGHYDFFAASADDHFRQRLMGRLVADARQLAASLPPEEMDARALTALKGLIAAAVALPDHAAFLTRALRVLPQEIGRRILPDGCHCERSPGPATGRAAGPDGNPCAAAGRPERSRRPPWRWPSSAWRRRCARCAMPMAALRCSTTAQEGRIDLADRPRAGPGRACRPAPASALSDGGFHGLQAGRSVLIMDCGVPPPAKIDRFAHAGTLSFELSIGRERLIVNCGAAPAAMGEWHDACRRSAPPIPR